MLYYKFILKEKHCYTIHTNLFWTIPGEFGADDNGNDSGELGSGEIEIGETEEDISDDSFNFFI